jgi:hypothetical protein
MATTERRQIPRQQPAFFEYHIICLPVCLDEATHCAEIGKELPYAHTTHGGIIDAV